MSKKVKLITIISLLAITSSYITANAMEDKRENINQESEQNEKYEYETTKPILNKDQQNKKIDEFKKIEKKEESSNNIKKDVKYEDVKYEKDLISKPKNTINISNKENNLKLDELLDFENNFKNCYNEISDIYRSLPFAKENENRLKVLKDKYKNCKNTIKENIKKYNNLETKNDDSNKNTINKIDESIKQINIKIKNIDDSILKDKQENELDKNKLDEKLRDFENDFIYIRTNLSKFMQPNNYSSSDVDKQIKNFTKILQKYNDFKAKNNINIELTKNIDNLISLINTFKNVQKALKFEESLQIHLDNLSKNFNINDISEEYKTNIENTIKEYAKFKNDNNYSYLEEKFEEIDKTVKLIKDNIKSSFKDKTDNEKLDIKKEINIEKDNNDNLNKKLKSYEENLKSYLEILEMFKNENDNYNFNQTELSTKNYIKEYYEFISINKDLDKKTTQSINTTIENIYALEEEKKEKNEKSNQIYKELSSYLKTLQNIKAQTEKDISTFDANKYLFSDCVLMSSKKIDKYRQLKNSGYIDNYNASKINKLISCIGDEQSNIRTLFNKIKGINRKIKDDELNNFENSFKNYLNELTKYSSNNLDDAKFSEIKESVKEEISRYAEFTLKNDNLNSAKLGRISEIIDKIYNLI